MPLLLKKKLFLKLDFYSHLLTSFHKIPPEIFNSYWFSLVRVTFGVNSIPTYFTISQPFLSLRCASPRSATSCYCLVRSCYHCCKQCDGDEPHHLYPYPCQPLTKHLSATTMNVFFSSASYLCQSREWRYQLLKYVNIKFTGKATVTVLKTLLILICGKIQIFQEGILRGLTVSPRTIRYFQERYSYTSVLEREGLTAMVT